MKTERRKYDHQWNIEDHFLSGWITSAGLLVFSALVVLVVRQLA